VESRLLLDVVVGQGAAILELLASENQALLIGGDALLVLDLGLDVVDGVRRLNLKGDGLACGGLDDCWFVSRRVLEMKTRKRVAKILTNLHATTKTKNQVEGGLLLNIVVRKGAAILELLASENQALLVRRNALLVLNLGLDIVDGIGGLDLESDGLASDCGTNQLAYVRSGGSDRADGNAYES
jgi:hypothetical protein